VRRSDGFSLAELLVATAITLVSTAVACVLAFEAQTLWRAESARVDLRQRSRVAVDALSRLLLDAGAGPYTGPSKGALLRVLAPVVPRRVGLRRADPFDSFRTDAISVLTAVSESEPARLLFPAAAATTTLDLATATCGLPACGFAAGSTLLVHDMAGTYDVFTVVDAQGSSLTVRHHGSGNAANYPAGSPIVQVESRSISFDPDAATLRIYDGDASDLPFLDDVVGVRVEYFGSPLPPAGPRPAEGIANCLYDADGSFRAMLLPVLENATPLVALGERALTDGPWCGTGENQFDADLLRLRYLRVTLRLQASDRAVRGSDPEGFLVPGTATTSGGKVPDVTVVVEVAPPNLRTVW
jgi:hypothetical protein